MCTRGEGRPRHRHHLDGHLTAIGAVIAGFVGIAYIQQSGITLDNPETVVLVMSQALLHPFVAGLVLAAVLAAIMSTISTPADRVLVGPRRGPLHRSSPRRQPSQKLLVILGRACVLVVAIVAGLLALNPSTPSSGWSRFAWAGFGAAFGPIVLLSLYWRKLTNWGALAGMIVGAATVFIWDAIEKANTVIVIAPGFSSPSTRSCRASCSR